MKNQDAIDRLVAIRDDHLALARKALTRSIDEAWMKHDSEVERIMTEFLAKQNRIGEDNS